MTRFSLVLIVVGLATLVLLVLALAGCGPKPRPAAPQLDAYSVCSGYTAEGYRCVACGKIGVYDKVDAKLGIYCVHEGIGCADSRCGALPQHP